MQISVFTDEIDPRSPARAIDLAAEWGITHVEIRSLPEGRFPGVPDIKLDSLYARITEAGLAVSGVSPGFCKCARDDPSVPRVLSEDLPRACEWARRWGTDMVTCFAFNRDTSDSIPSAVFDLLGDMSEITRRHGCRLSLENETSCWGDTGIEAAAIIRQIGAEYISLCWDPGNSARAGSAYPYPDEYSKIKDIVSHVHMKNLDPKTQSWSLVDQGVVDWSGQLGALLDDDYDGFLVIETHLHISPDEFRVVGKQLSNLECNTLHNLTFVRSCLKKS